MVPDSYELLALSAQETFEVTPEDQIRWIEPLRQCEGHKMNPVLRFGDSQIEAVLALPPSTPTSLCGRVAASHADV